MNAPKIVLVTDFEGSPIRIHAGTTGTYVAEYWLRGYWQETGACPTVAAALHAAQDRLRWEDVASNPNA